MKYDKDIFVVQYRIVHLFVQHYAYYCSQKQSEESSEIWSEYWTASTNSFLMMAALYWCKIFGSDGCNPTHWKRVIRQDAEKLQNDFRTRLLQAEHISDSEWQDYHQGIRDFRDKFVAHTEREYTGPVPDFKLALEVAFIYEDWVLDLIRPDIYRGPCLRTRFEQWLLESEHIASGNGSNDVNGLPNN